MNPCPCFYFEMDPDLTTDPAVRVCACGHTDDEHDERGECLTDVEEE